MKDLKAIRAQVRQRRKAIEADDRQEFDALICRSMSELQPFQDASRVAGYLSFDGEANPLDLMLLALELGKQVYVPIIEERNRPLWFAPWSCSIPMKLNRFGIEEPDVPRTDWIQPEELDFVINPLVAFDSQCHRIGVGGGFYDRSFSFLQSVDSPAKRSTTLAGFAYETQRLDEIDNQPWDVTLDCVVTENKIYQP